MSKIGIFVGSVYGNAQHVAEEVKTMLSGQGIESEVFTDPTLNDFKQVSSILFISSTTGQGDIPPNLEFFVQDLRDQSPLMGQKPFAVAGLGDKLPPLGRRGGGPALLLLLLLGGGGGAHAHVHDAGLPPQKLEC